MTFDDFNLDKCADGLLPVIIQDSVTLRVLMLGYMNREAFDLTCSTGHVTFYSRTRSCLWTKGETSGHFLDVVDMYADWDGVMFRHSGRGWFHPLAFRTHKSPSCRNAGG